MRKEPLVLEVHADGHDEVLAVEEGPYRYLDPLRVLLDQELLDLLGPVRLVVLQDVQDVLAVGLLADEQELLLVLGLAARLEHVPVRVALNELHRLVELREVPGWKDVHACQIELRLAVLPVELELVRIGGAPHHELPLVPQLLRLGPESHVVEDYHVCPFFELLPLVHLLEEPEPHVLLCLTVAEHLHIVALLLQLPREVRREALVRDEQEFHLTVFETRLVNISWPSADRSRASRTCARGNT